MYLYKYGQNSYCIPIFSMLQYSFAKMWGGGGGARGSYLVRGLYDPIWAFVENMRVWAFIIWHRFPRVWQRDKWGRVTRLVWWKQVSLVLEVRVDNMLV